MPDNDEAKIPKQKEHYQLSARFGAVPVDEARAVMPRRDRYV